ncbi:MAG: hypothetical protein KDE48_12215 [Anaerolineales bacterium]|nr:hypothetical protein [Anaerolineales bacterium]
MKLTRRQTEFIENLIEMTQELRGPIHYSMLADRLGVSPFTAYDMLRVLEEKGMVTSEYHLPEGKSGPGRAERLFCPVKPNEAQMQRLLKAYGTQVLDKQNLQQFVLKKLQNGDAPNQEVAEELLARIPPDGPENIRYCVEVMTVIAMRLRKRAGQKLMLSYLPKILQIDGVVSHANLCLLGGFCFGLLVQDETNDDEWSKILFEHVQQYHIQVLSMNQDECTYLANDLLTVFASLN